MARATTPDEEQTDELTENGILTGHPDVTMVDYEDLHGEPRYQDDDVVVFADQHGYELNEWADALDMDRSDLSARMHELAREHLTYGDAGSGAGDPWAVNDPVVFDARTFED